MRITIPVLLLFLILISAGSATQAQEKSGLIKSARGILVVWNEPGNYYTVDIKGQKIIPSNQPLLFQVDGVFFQIQTAPKKAFLTDGKDKKLDNKAILAAHREWEREYISGIIKSDLRIDSVWLKLPDDRDVLAWSYDMPKLKDDQSANRQLYLAVVKRNHIFLLNTAVTANDDEKTLRAMLLETMKTMKSSDKPLSLEKASQQAMKDNN